VFSPGPARAPLLLLLLHRPAAAAAQVALRRVL